MTQYPRFMNRNPLVTLLGFMAFSVFGNGAIIVAMYRLWNALYQFTHGFDSLVFVFLIATVVIRCAANVVKGIMNSPSAFVMLHRGY